VDWQATARNWLRKSAHSAGADPPGCSIRASWLPRPSDHGLASRWVSGSACGPVPARSGRVPGAHPRQRRAGAGGETSASHDADDPSVAASQEKDNGNARDDGETSIGIRDLRLANLFTARRHLLCSAGA